MALSVLGLNHTTAPVALRERLAFGPDIVESALHSLCQLPEVAEAVIISTCNRTELYLSADQEPEIVTQAVIAWLATFQGIPVAEITPNIYGYQDQQAVEHILAVASGLDSLILGEPQILGQVKTAYQTAQQAGCTGKLLQRLFQHAFSTAKQVRSDTRIGEHPVSVAYAAVRLAQRIFTDLGEQTALLIGAGDTIELAARHLQQQTIGHLIIANRTLSNAQPLASECGAEAIGLTSIASRLSEVDILISATASPLPVIGKGAVEQALKARRHSPILMVDLAVPRDIEPEVATLCDIYLYSVDDMQNVIQENRRSREVAAEQARAIVADQVAEFVAWQESLAAVEVIQEYRTQAEGLRDEVLQKAQRMLQAGKPAKAVLDYLAHTLTNKILHVPSEQMRQAASQGQQDILAVANTLFQLNKHDG